MQIHNDERFQRLIGHMEAALIQGDGNTMQLILEQLQTLAETEQDDIGLAAAYFYRDILFGGRPGDKTYMEYAKRSLIISSTKNIPYYHMKASNSLGILYSEISDFHTSLEYYLNAIHIAEDHPEFCYASVVLNNVGNLFVWLDNYAEAAVYLERAYRKAVVENLDDGQLIVTIILNLVELYSNMENYEKVLEWEKESAVLSYNETQPITDCINMINTARKLVSKGQMEEASKIIRSFAALPIKSTEYIYILRCCINAIRLGILMDDFSLCTLVMDKMEQVQSETSMTSFAYDYTTVRVEYYNAFQDKLKGRLHSFFKDYFIESQNRIEQLRSTYARSLSVKIALEEVKTENKNVHLKNEQLQRDIERDIFTNLYNKVSTEKHISKALKDLQPGEYQGFILIDIDLFKRINDNFGHSFGDLVIAKVAEAIEGMPENPKIAGRFGGDEFLVFISKQKSSSSIEEAASSLLTRVRTCIDMPDDRISAVTLSMGVCVIDSAHDFKECFEKADAALYKAKENGRNRFEKSSF